MIREIVESQDRVFFAVVEQRVNAGGVVEKT